MNDPDQQHQHEREPTTYKYVTIIEYNEHAEEFDYQPGRRVVLSGIHRDVRVNSEESEGFPNIGDTVAIIELHEPLSEDCVTEWCNSPAGKLALAHWFDHYDPAEVVMT